MVYAVLSMLVGFIAEYAIDFNLGVIEVARDGVTDTGDPVHLFFKNPTGDVNPRSSGEAASESGDPG